MKSKKRERQRQQQAREERNRQLAQFDICIECSDCGEREFVSIKSFTWNQLRCKLCSAPMKLSGYNASPVFAGSDEAKKRLTPSNQKR